MLSIFKSNQLLFLLRLLDIQEKVNCRCFYCTLLLPWANATRLHTFRHFGLLAIMQRGAFKFMRAKIGKIIDYIPGSPVGWRLSRQRILSRKERIERKEMEGGNGESEANEVTL